MILNLIDAGCGIGKTSALINYINDSSDKKFIFATPYLSEVIRIKEKCSDKAFKTPIERETKKEDIINLIREGHNIATTHALLNMLSEMEANFYKLLADYTLIIDETLTFIDPLQITKDDMNIIIKEYATIDDNDMLHWRNEQVSYEGRFEDYKQKIKSGSVYANKDINGRVTSLIWIYPYNFLASFQQLFLLTYNFKGLGLAYCKLKNIEIKPLYVKNFHLTTEKQIYDYSKTKNCIHVLEDKKLNEIGNAYGALSYSWYERHKGRKEMEVLKKTLGNFFKHKTKGKSDDRLWTTFKQYEDYLADKGYKKNFVAHNIKATNQYINTKHLAYTINRFMNPVTQDFLNKNDANIDADEYALCEVIQFIFRSRARINQPIDIFIPSRRMRFIVNNWLKRRD